MVSNFTPQICRARPTSPSYEVNEVLINMSMGEFTKCETKNPFKNSPKVRLKNASPGAPTELIPENFFFHNKLQKFDHFRGTF